MSVTTCLNILLENLRLCMWVQSYCSWIPSGMPCLSNLAHPYQHWSTYSKEKQIWKKHQLTSLNSYLFRKVEIFLNRYQHFLPSWQWHPNQQSPFLPFSKLASLLVLKQLKEKQMEKKKKKKNQIRSDHPSVWKS